MSDPAENELLAARRHAMVEVQLRARGIRDPRVLEAMRRVPRHHFVSADHQDEAYDDHPIPIGFGQTISQPYIVAAMLASLQLTPQDVVLEVGAGSGYQTALLAELAALVVAIERYAPLAQRARETLHSLGYNNAKVVVADGSLGYAEDAPYDAILVAAAAPQIPPPLLEQLREGGRMILPVGMPDSQVLQLVRKMEGRFDVVHLDPCRFVPLLGREGFQPG
jgi:protein-L-isoaspartate(D-aspartate) O-methyltransferase